MEKDRDKEKKDKEQREREGPEPGTWAYTARLMARAFPPAEEDPDFWDRWKDEMKDSEIK